MLLQKLRQYADERMALPPSLYAMTPVAWVVELDPDGRPLSPIPTSRIDPSTARGKRGIDMLAPEVQRSSGIRPLLLADNGEYTFGIAREPEKQARAAASHTAYRELLAACSRASGSPALKAVERFYERGGSALLELGDTWDYGLKVTFRVHLPDDAMFPIDLPEVRAFWLAHNAPASELAQCHVCGARQPVLARLQSKVKGIRSGNKAGTSIISANLDAFHSYGLEASNVAPTCKECGERFTRAVNELLAGSDTHLNIGNADFIFWTRRASAGFDWNALLTEPDPGQVYALIDSVRRGTALAEFDDDAFYAAALSGSGGRAVVRDWIDTSVGEVRRQAARWFQLQEVVDPYGGPHRPLGLHALAFGTVRRPADLPATTPRVLFHAALTGTPLPLQLAFEAVRRNRAEQDINRQRAALIKLVLLSQSPPPTEDYMIALEPEHPSVAYQCGRLLAVLEEIQRAALPGINATIIDRFFGTASSAPAGVFGRLVRGAQPHLARLERDRRGAYVALQRRMEEVCGRIAEFPRVLSLDEQALFSLGYYHQRAFDRAEAAARSAAAPANRPIAD